MPERLPTARPTVLAGTNMTSGDPNTGQAMFTMGGAKTFSQQSGALGVDYVIWKGGGRLDHVELHPTGGSLGSGILTIFYDTAVASSGGPIAASGHKIISKLHPGSQAYGSVGIGQIQSGSLNLGGYFPIGRVFTSGLVLASLSGMNGVTVSYTPVVSGTNPNFA